MMPQPHQHQHQHQQQHQQQQFPVPFPVPAPVSATRSTHRLYSDIRLENPVLTQELMAQQPRQPYNQGYMPNGAPGAHANLSATPLLPNQGRVIQNGPVRVLCIADVRGKINILRHGQILTEN